MLSQNDPSRMRRDSKAPEIPTTLRPDGGRRRQLPAGALLIALFALAACSDSGDSGTNPGLSNAPPVAVASSDGLATAGAVVTLDGSGSQDPDGDALTYRWTQTEGPAVGTLPGAAVATFSAPDAVGTLAFELVVSDGESQSAPAPVRILVVRDRNRAIFVSSSGSDSGQGTRESPLATLAEASRRAATRQADLYLAAGTWQETLELSSGSSVYGGFDPSSWSRDPVVNRSRIVGPAGESADVAVRGDGVQNLTVDGVAIEGRAPGLAAVLLRDARGIVLAGVDVSAPAGMDGAAGSDASGRGGFAPSGSRGENAGVCSRTGGRGGSGSAGRTTGGRGGDGGAISGDDGRRGNGGGGGGGAGGSGLGDGGRAGSRGGDGSSGSAGSRGAAFGSVTSAGTYTPASGGRGGVGRPGGAGGGGGGGGGAVLGLCGGGGGGGGAGGRGGIGGQGGSGGQASIGILLMAGADARVLGSTIRTAGGGDGGAGGNGGLGEQGGAPGIGGSSGAGGGGGNGGRGGRGGRGGAGGGGGGGPSIGILVVSSSVDATGNSYEIAPGGSGGPGGRTGQDGVTAEVHEVN